MPSSAPGTWLRSIARCGTGFPACGSRGPSPPCTEQDSRAMTFDDVEAIALQWPGVETGTSYGTPALKVRKKLLARLKGDGETLVMPGGGSNEREMLIETQPRVFYFTDHYRDWPI